MIIEKIETVSGFAGMRDEWDSLLEASASNCVFLTHEWLFTWWKHLAEGRSLSILAARVKGRLVGILPLALRQPQYARMIPRSFEFLGSGVIGSDYLDAIVMPGCEEEAIRCFSESLSGAGVVLHLSQLRRESSIAARLGKHLQADGWHAADSQMNVCPFIDLHGRSWESYLGTLSSNQRYNFNRRYRNLTKKHEVVFRNGALDVLINLHHQRWGSKGMSEAFQTDAIVEFHREFTGLAAARGWLRLLTLEIDNVAAAALYGLRYGNIFYFYQSGFDPAYNKHSVGLVLMGLSIKSAIEEGASEFDLLHGTEEYKFHWTKQTRKLGRLELYPRHAGGRVSRHAVVFNRAARRIAKRMLGRAA